MHGTENREASGQRRRLGVRSAACNQRPGAGAARRKARAPSGRLAEREGVHEGAVQGGYNLVLHVGGVGDDPQVAVAQLDVPEDARAEEVDVGGQPCSGMACRTGEGAGIRSSTVDGGGRHAKVTGGRSGRLGSKPSRATGRSAAQTALSGLRRRRIVWQEVSCRRLASLLSPPTDDKVNRRSGCPVNVLTQAAPPEDLAGALVAVVVAVPGGIHLAGRGRCHMGGAGLRTAAARRRHGRSTRAPGQRQTPALSLGYDALS